MGMNSFKDLLPISIYKGIPKQQLRKILSILMFDQPFKFGTEREEIYKNVGHMISSVAKNKQKISTINYEVSNFYKNSPFKTNPQTIVQKLPQVDVGGTSNSPLKFEIHLEPDTEITYDLEYGIDNSQNDKISKCIDQINHDLNTSGNNSINETDNASKNDFVLQNDDKGHISCEIQISKQSNDTDSTSSIKLNSDDISVLTAIKDKFKKAANKNDTINKSSLVKNKDANSSEIMNRKNKINKEDKSSDNGNQGDTRPSTNEKSEANINAKITEAQNFYEHYNKTIRDKKYPSVNSKNKNSMRKLNSESLHNEKTLLQLSTKKQLKGTKTKNSATNNRKYLNAGNSNTFNHRKYITTKSYTKNLFDNYLKRKNASLAKMRIKSLSTLLKDHEAIKNEESTVSKSRSESQLRTFLDHPRRALSTSELKKMINSNYLKFNFFHEQKVKNEEQKTPNGSISALKSIKNKEVHDVSQKNSMFNDMMTNDGIQRSNYLQSSISGTKLDKSIYKKAGKRSSKRSTTSDTKKDSLTKLKYDNNYINKNNYKDFFISKKKNILQLEKPKNISEYQRNRSKSFTSETENKKNKLMKLKEPESTTNVKDIQKKPASTANIFSTPTAYNSACDILRRKLDLNNKKSLNKCLPGFNYDKYNSHKHEKCDKYLLLNDDNDQSFMRHDEERAKNPYNLLLNKKLKDSYNSINGYQINSSLRSNSNIPKIKSYDYIKKGNKKKVGVKKEKKLEYLEVKNKIRNLTNAMEEFENENYTSENKINSQKLNRMNETVSPNISKHFNKELNKRSNRNNKMKNKNNYEFSYKDPGQEELVCSWKRGRTDINTFKPQTLTFSNYSVINDELLYKLKDKLKETKNIFHELKTEYETKYNTTGSKDGNVTYIKAINTKNQDCIPLYENPTHGSKSRKPHISLPIEAIKTIIKENQQKSLNSNKLNKNLINKTEKQTDVLKDNEERFSYDLKTLHHKRTWNNDLKPISQHNINKHFSCFKHCNLLKRSKNTTDFLESAEKSNKSSFDDKDTKNLEAEESSSGKLFERMHTEDICPEKNIIPSHRHRGLPYTKNTFAEQNNIFVRKDLLSNFNNLISEKNFNKKSKFQTNNKQIPFDNSKDINSIPILKPKSNKMESYANKINENNINSKIIFKNIQTDIFSIKRKTEYVKKNETSYPKIFINSKEFLKRSEFLRNDKTNLTSPKYKLTTKSKLFQQYWNTLKSNKNSIINEDLKAGHNTPETDKRLETIRSKLRFLKKDDSTNKDQLRENIGQITSKKFQSRNKNRGTALKAFYRALHKKHCKYYFDSANLELLDFNNDCYSANQPSSYAYKYKNTKKARLEDRFFSKFGETELDTKADNSQTII